MSDQNENVEGISDALEKAFKMGANTAEVIGIEGYRNVILAPNDFHLLNLPEEPKERPDFKDGATKFNDLKSFCEYVGIHKVEGETNLFAYGDTVNAVINNHSAERPGQADFTAKLVLIFSTEWLAWTEAASGRLSQEDLAELIEDQIKTIAEPDGSDLLDMVRNLKMTRNVSFKSVIDDFDGSVQFEYVNVGTDGETGPKNEFSIPDQFMLMLPIFKNGEPLPVAVKLRYQLLTESASVRFVIKIMEQARLLDTALEQVYDAVADQTGISVWL